MVIDGTRTFMETSNSPAEVLDSGNRSTDAWDNKPQRPRVARRRKSYDPHSQGRSMCGACVAAQWVCSSGALDR